LLVAASAPTHLRDDFFMKLVFAHAMGLADPAELIARQRAVYVRALGELERVLAAGGAPAGAKSAARCPRSRSRSRRSRWWPRSQPARPLPSPYRWPCAPSEEESSQPN
jgi:hypothetical protein